MTAQQTLKGVATSTLASADLDATFVPGAGRVGSALRHRGEDRLGRRGGLARYIAERGTMGVPLLHPYPNRLASRRFTAASHDVVLDGSGARVTTDDNGLPMHGLLAAAGGWDVEH